MSGLTPIIDTLLHQVFGKRGDVQRSSLLRPDRVVNEVTASTTSKAVSSDARLQTPVADLQTSDKTFGRADGARSPREATSELSGVQSRLPAKGEVVRDAKLRLSQPGQLISHLQRSTAEGMTPTVRPPGVLMDAAARPAPAADEVAQRLANTISESGLFYESHLRQWHRGERSVAELSREPQMRIWQKAGPAGSDTYAAPANRGHSLPGVAVSLPRGELPWEFSLYAPSARVTGSENAAFGRSAAEPNAENSRQVHVAGQTSGVSEYARSLPLDLQDRLQSVVRNQLELFGAATMRWEGEVDDGFLMFMEIGLPQEHRRSHRDADGSAFPDKEGGEDWTTTLELELPLLGEITVTLRRTKDCLSVGLGVECAETAALMDSRTAEIAERLACRGAPSPTIRVAAAE